MPTVAALGTQFNLPNYTGEVLNVTPADTPFLTAIGNLGGQGEVVASTRFEGQTQDLAAPAQPGILEGAAAPTASNRSRASWNNLVQIFQRQVSVSYTRQAINAQLAGLGIAGAANPIQDELAYQIELGLTGMSRDINYTLLRGSYQLPEDNTTARKTRGLLEAITTNTGSNLGPAIACVIEADDDTFTAAGHGLSTGQRVFLSDLVTGTGITDDTTYWVIAATTNTFKVSTTEGGSAVAVSADGTANVQLYTPLTAVHVLDMIQDIYDTHGVNTSAEPTLIVNSRLKRALSKLFVTDKNYQEMTRNVGGVNLQRIETDFGPINIMLERNQESSTIVLAHLGLIRPAWLPIPGKGYLFAEELSRTGASINYQLYAECGLWHGPEQAHAKLTDVGYVAGA